MSAAFDTLSYARRMEGVGFTRAQAEAMAEEQAKLIDKRLATKTDIAAIHSDIEALRLATKTDIAAIQRDIEALRLATKSDIERLATKTDIAAVKANIEALRLSTKADMELLRRDMIIRLGGIVIASAAVASTIVTLLSRLPFAHP